jgi:quercetin dioxygenase-like cupin family protein
LLALKDTGEIMKDFPGFMKNSANKVDSKSQYTPGIEGYVFDGADESQMAFWTYKQDAISKQHSHEYDEYIAVIQGQFIIIIENNRKPLNSGDEYVIPKGVVHSGEVIAGTRAIYAFGGKRAKRENRNK